MKGESATPRTHTHTHTNRVSPPAHFLCSPWCFRWGERVPAPSPPAPQWGPASWHLSGQLSLCSYRARPPRSTARYRHTHTQVYSEQWLYHVQAHDNTVYFRQTYTFFFSQINPAMLRIMGVTSAKLTYKLIYINSTICDSAAGPCVREDQHEHDSFSHWFGWK